MSKVIHIKDENFEREVIESEIPVLVDFWAPWCGPCKMLGPIVEELAEEYAGRIKVAKVDVDKNQQVAAAMGVRSVPMVALFDGKEVVDAMVGVRPKAAIAASLDRYLKKLDKKRKKEEKRRRNKARKAAAA